MNNCKKHKLRENTFGVLWCIKCGFLSNTLHWNLMIFDRLNGFSGIDTIKFNLIKS